MASMQIFSSIKYGDDSAVQAFFLENGLRHTQYANAIFKGNGQQMPLFDVFDSKMVSDLVDMMKKPEKDRRMTLSLRNWLLLHASLHDAEIKALSIQQNFNLYDADFTKSSSFQDWLDLHSSLHDYEDKILGV